MTPPGSTLSKRMPSCGPLCLRKYHQGMPFCAVNTAVCDPIIAGRSRTTAPTMRLHAENDQILLANVGNSIARLDASDEFLAFFDQGQSVPHNSRKMRASDDDAHVLACTGKFGGQQAADRAGANYANLHG